MKLLATVSLLALAYGAMATQAFAQWRPLGLSGRQVTALRHDVEFLYACTNQGLFRLAVDSADSTWTGIGFAGQSVLDLAILGPQTLLAARFLSGTPGDTVSLFRSVDGGGTWQPFQNGFGAGAGRQARKLLVTADGTVFAANSRIEKSDDGGLSWRVVHQAQVLNALESSPASAQLLWAGGETVLFQAYVLKSTDGGETWTRIDLFAGGDNAVDAIAAHPTEPEVVYLGMEGKVMKSEDGGSHWTTVTSPDPSLYTVGLAIRPFLPLKVFAAGGSYVPDPRGVVFYQSEDAGQTWQSLAYPADAGTGVRHLLLRTGAVDETVYVATDNGVYRHTQATVGVSAPESERLVLLCRPNPFTAAASVEFHVSASERATLTILDLQGRTVAVLLDAAVEPGPHRTAFDARRLRTGVYFARLKTSAGMTTLRLLHLE